MTYISPHRAGVSLRELLATEAIGATAPNVLATGCTDDWRHVRAGDVFVAVTDADADGHDFAAEAAERGAAVVICERPLPVFDIPQCIVADSRAVYGRLCQALVGHPTQQLKVIGVTGTHGKTTVTRLLTAILREAGAVAGTLDSLGYCDGLDDHSPFDAPTSPPVLARSLAEMAAAGASHAVVEVSSCELSRQVFAGATLDTACVTQVGRNHLDWYGSIENYRQTKQRIFEYVHASGMAVLNADDPVSVRMLCDLDLPALTYAMQKPAEVTAEVVERHVNEQTFVLSAGDESVGVRTAIIGDHHIYNCLAAATTALAYGIELRAIARGLEAVESLPGRMQRIVCGQDFAIFIDAADSSASLRACLRAARQVTTGRLICVLGADNDREAGDWPAMGRVAGAFSEIAVVTNNELQESSHRSCIGVHAGFADRRKARVIIQRDKAIAWALAEARAGDTVVVAGLGERLVCPPHDDDPPTNDYAIICQLLSGGLPLTSQPRLAA